MHPELNPFTPGSGLRPPNFAGREGEVSAFDLLVARSLRKHSGASLVLHGYRGVGKTVLLNAMQDQAERAGWLCIGVEAQDSKAGPLAIRQRIGRKLHNASNRFRSGKTYTAAVSRALGTLTGFSLSLGVVSIETTREPADGRAQSGILEVDLEELVEDFADALRENSAAIGIFIDEMQDIDDDLLTALLTVQNRAGQKNIPFYVIGAGLPTLPARLAGARSYSERLFEYRHIDALSTNAAVAAIREPLTRNNFAIDDDALDLLLGAARGYPYFLQLFGKEVWNATETRRISLATAERALKSAYAQLDQGYFRSSWDRADPVERSILRYMAFSEDAEDYPADDVLQGCGLDASTFGAARESLISKGVVFMSAPGRLSFTTPGMPGHVRRRSADLG